MATAPYVINPDDPTQPTENLTMGAAAAELRGLKQRVLLAREETADLETRALTHEGANPYELDAQLNANGNKITGLATATVGSDAVPLSQVAGLIGGASTGLVAVLEEEFTATAGQTVFNLTVFTYLINSNNLAVYVNGLRQDRDVAYVETDIDTVTFLVPLQAGDAVQFFKNEGTTNVADAVLRSDLASTAIGKGAALIGENGGGTVQDAIDSIAAKPSNALASPSYRIGLNYSQIDPSVISAWTFDGASGFPNKLGVNNTNPVTGTWTPDTGYVANGAAYSAILGGYDNVANGLASMVASMHSMVYSAADHGTIYGGSVNAVEKGSYSSVWAGTNNRITALRNDGVTASPGSNSHVLGGRDNRATNSNATVVGGQSQIVDGEYASAIGGSTNRALGNFDHVAGSNNETRRGTLGAGQRNTIGGGRFNVIDSVTSPSSNTISGGEDHEVYGSFNAIGGGDNGTIGQAGTNSAYGVIGGGLDNTVTALNAGTVGGGRGNSVTADYGTVVGGRDNAASGQYSTAGGYQAVARHDYGISYGASRFAANGDAQFSTVARKITTTDDTSTAMQTILLPDDSTYVFSALIVARRTDADNESGGYKIEGVIDRNSGAGTTALVGTPVVTTIAEDTAAFNASVAANAGSGGLAISVVGEAGKTIRWVAKVDLVEVTG